jgi:pyruvate-ferredoxin/flavodoxin oxidoreductase
VIAQRRNVNLLVLDTEVYSNTGGQSSKSTPLGAVAKFAAGGKPVPKKDLGLLAMMYGHVYVAKVAMGANEMQTLKAFIEAESYDGPSLIIAYSHCIAHGIDMVKGMDQQRLAVESGYWPLYRYDPRLRAQGKNPLQIDSKPPKVPLEDYIYNENRYRMLQKSNPTVAAHLLKLAKESVAEQWNILQRLAAADAPANGAKAPEAVEAATGNPRNETQRKED